VLVDSASSDRTHAIMAEFAHRRGAEFYALSGEVNASVARNVILAHAPVGHLLLLDGDIVLNPAFLSEAIEILDGGSAKAVCGSLLDKYHDVAGNFTGETYLRYGTRSAGPVRSTGGIIAIAAIARSASVRFDETLDRNEDTDFSLRLSRSGTITFIKTPMGEHLTQRYYEGQRGRQWFVEQHPRSIGRLIVRHLNGPDLLHIAQLEKGVAIGALLLLVSALAIVLSLMGLPIALAVAALLWLADLLQFVRRKSLSDYTRTRVFSPLFALKGLFDTGRHQPQYHLNKVV